VKTKQNRIISAFLALVIAGATLLTACDNCGGDGGAYDDVSLPNANERTPEVQATLTSKAMDIFQNSENLLFEIDISGLNVTFYRRGDDIVVLLLDVLAFMVVDGYYYDFAHDKGTVTRRPATEADVEGVMDTVMTFGELIQLDGAAFVASGRETFLGTADVFYEEFIDQERTPRKAYFDGDGNLVGIMREVHDENLPNVAMQQFRASLSEEVDQWVFDITMWADFELVDKHPE